MDIGTRIRQRREELGLSQEELAMKVGYKSRSSINKIETDGRGLPQSKIVAFAAALNTTPADLMGWVDDLPLHAFNYQKFLSSREFAPFVNAWRSLNELGQKKVWDYMNDLLQIKSYRNECVEVDGQCQLGFLDDPKPYYDDVSIYDITSEQLKNNAKKNESTPNPNTTKKN